MSDLVTENYRLLLGDSAERMSELADDQIDLTVTSPPYDDLRNYNGSYNFNFEEIVKQLYRVTKPGGIVVWNVADGTVDGSETGTSFRQALFFIETGFKLHDTMIYEKGNFSNPSTNRYHQIFEYMFVFSKGKPKTFNPIKDKKVTSDYFGKNTVRNVDGTMTDRPRKEYAEWGMRTNIWRMKTAGQEAPCKKIPHPAKMPDGMAHDHIISWSNVNDTIFDPFAGMATTGVQALKLSRKFVGIEISTEYFELAKNQLEAASPHTLFEVS